MIHSAVRRALLLAAPVCLAPAWAATPADQVIEEVVVVGVTPLDVLSAETGVRTASAADIQASNALDVAAYANHRMPSVYLNEVQGNPLQADLNFRGFTASPLLGTPQGLSVYLDGVRLNQPFGDVVSWDLIPRTALNSLSMLPGANPLFGLNTLGGAAVLTTKDGWSAPGTGLEASYGSWERRRFEAETGGNTGEQGWAWYATANRFDEDGWRDFSPSEATQGFAKASWRDGDTRIDASVLAADTDLNGNGLQDIQLLRQRRESVYTWPDNTQNRAVLANLALRQQVGSRAQFAANAWYRNIRSITFNGDINEESLEENVYQPSAGEIAALIEAGYTGFPLSGENAGNTPFPRWRCIANVLTNEEPNEKCNGLLNRGRTSQHEYGLNAQFDVELPLAGLDNDLTLGASYSRSRAHFTQSSQYGYLAPDRSVIGVDGPGAFADGTQDSEDAYDARVDLGGHTRTWSLYASDSIALTPALRLTASARYDRTEIRNRDALQPEGGTGSLNGDHTFDRVNPALGLTFRASPALELYAQASQGSRAPSAIELGCADPDSPCRLPNSMAGDPPLDPVVTTSFEAGARGRVGSGLTWTAGVFRSDNRDDILFVADEQAGFGYFRNFGKTRRQGFEIGVQGQAGALRYGVDYTYLDATFRSSETVNGEANSSNDGPAPGFEGNIDIEPGDRLTLVPRHVAKAFLEWQVLPQLRLGADWRYIGGSIARGNENGEHQPDGVYHLGPGGSGGYGVVDLGLTWRPVPALDVYVQVDNVLDREYATASQLGGAGFTTTGEFVSRPFAGPVIDGERPGRWTSFHAPGAPRSYVAGLRYRFGG